MNMRKKKVKHMIAFVLLLTMISALVYPIGNMDVKANEISDTELWEEEDKTEVPPDQNGNAPTEADLPKVDLESVSNPEEADQKEDALEKTTDQTTENIQDAAQDVSDERTEDAVQENPAEKETVPRAAGSFESDPPVIEKVEFEQSGKTVKNNEKISLSVYAYDASAIKDIRIGISSGNADSLLTVYPMTWKKGTKENEYICEYQLDGTNVGRLTITSIVVIDEHENQAAYDGVHTSGAYQYWVDVEPQTNDTIKVKNFNFPDNGKVLANIDFKNLSLETAEKIKDESVWVHFATVSGSYLSLKLSAGDGGDTHSIFNKIDSRTMSSLNGSSLDKKYILKDIYVERGIFKVKTSLTMDNKDAYSFTFEGNETNSNVPVITAVELDKNKQIVKPGETIHITVSAKSGDGAELAESGGINFNAAASDISSDASNKHVQLKLDPSDQKYHGSLLIEDMYPCEWYVSNISIYNKNQGFGDFAEDSSFTDGANYPYYIQVYNGDAYVNPTYDVNIGFWALNESGQYENISNISKENVERRKTLKDMGIVFPDISSKYQGLTQTGWMDHSGNEVTADTPILENTANMLIYAKYDKGVWSARYNYPDSEGVWKIAFQPIVFEYGETYGNLVKKAQGYIPEDIAKEYSFGSWESDPYLADGDVVSAMGELQLTAKFSGVNYIQYYREYYDEKGSTYGHNIYSFPVKEGTKAADTVSMLKKLDLPKMYAGLRFKEWEISSYSNVDTVENGQYFMAKAVYENCLVRYILNHSKSEEGTIFCQVAEKGEMVTALTTFEGFGKVTWDNAPEETFVVNDHMTFYGKAESVSADPGNPSQPSRPSKPSSDSGDDTVWQPDSKLPDAAVDQILQTINNSVSGEAFEITMGTKTVISKEILEAARGKDVTLILKMDGYTWTVNGMDIQAVNLEDIDLRVIKYTNNIPSQTVQALSGGNPTMQITLAHEGNFGFKATLTIGIGAEHSGKYGNLFYHDSAGKMVFIDAGPVDSNGNVSLTFSHASDYLIVISDRMMSQADVPKELMPAETGNLGQSMLNNGSVGKSVNTGDHDTVFPWIAVSVSMFGIIVLLSKKIKTRK